MTFLDDLRGAFTKAKRGRGGGPSNTMPTGDALEALSSNIVGLLAQFAGQTQTELDSTFELLPVGTRIALDHVGAIRLLDDEGGERFGLEAQPFAVELVTAAAQLVLSTRQGPPAAEEAPPVRHHDALPLAAGASLGTASAKGRAVQVDRQNQTARIGILKSEDDDRPGGIQEEVIVPLSLADDAFTTGAFALVDFDLYQPGTRPPAAPAAAAPDSTAGDLVPVHFQAGRVTFYDGHGPSNALAQVTAVRVLKEPA